MKNTICGMNADKICVIGIGIGLLGLAFSVLFLAFNPQPKSPTNFNPQPYSTTNDIKKPLGAYITAKTNTVKWMGKLIYSKGNVPRDPDVFNWVDRPSINVDDETQIGLREDGVVVWRKKP